MTTTEPVHDWGEDYDIFDPDYLRCPYPIWDDLRPACPVAHTERWGGSWLPTRYEDVNAIAHDTEHFSSRSVFVTDRGPVYDPDEPERPHTLGFIPPISSDPPDHHWARRLILPFFSPKAVLKYEAYTRALCNELIDGFVGAGRADAAQDYAQQIPPRVIAEILGVDPGQADQFVEWVRGGLEIGQVDPEVRMKTMGEMIPFFLEQLEDRKEHPKDDLITYLLGAEVDGHQVTDRHALGTSVLTLVAGIDTTWSSIGSALWHLATDAGDRRRLVAEPTLLPVAIEELLRAYAPVTMARICIKEVTIGGRTLQPGDRVLLSFPAANRDPEIFPDAGDVVIDREVNRHIAFGAGIHRCAGSNLARMEMRVAVSTWLDRIPEFDLADPDAVTWAGGQVRGPRVLPVVFP